MLPNRQSWDGLREGVAEVGVQRVAAVACPEAGVDGQLHQVRESSDLLGTGRLTARQSTKLIQIDGFGPFRSQIGVNEREMADLIVGVIMDILVHVLIQHLHGRGIGWIPSSPWNFAVLDAGEFVVLLPQIGFDDFCCRQESENGRVSLRKTATLILILILIRRLAVGAVANSPAPMVPAPTASDVPKKERRLIELLKGLALSSKLSSRVSALFMAGSLTLGFDVEVVNNDAVDLLIGFIWRLPTPVVSAAIAHW